MYAILSDESLASYPDWSMSLAAGVLADAGACKIGEDVGAWRLMKAFWEFQVSSLLNSQRTMRCVFLFSCGITR